jgi:hypothetical protein
MFTMGHKIEWIQEFNSIGSGRHAIQSLKSQHHWEVWGNTSKGIFLKGKSNELIFLSNEKFRGPLTINFDPTIGSYFDRIEVGSKVIYQPETGLVFEPINGKLIVDDQHPWEPGPFTSTRKDLGIWNNLDLLGGWLNTATPIGSFAHTSSLAALDIEPVEKEKVRLFQLIRDIHAALKETNSQQFVVAAQNLIGLGAGLTPSGDDFLSGMVLGIARFSKNLPILSKYLPWFEEIIPIFEGKTTLLSSELFKVSLLGSADERIIGAFDSVMRKKLIMDQVVLPISKWGSSSGFDMMSGFYLLMKANQS